MQRAGDSSPHFFLSKFKSIRAYRSGATAAAAAAAVHTSEPDIGSYTQENASVPPFQLQTTPGSRANHIPKGNLVYIFSNVNTVCVVPLAKIRFFLSLFVRLFCFFSTGVHRHPWKEWARLGADESGQQRRYAKQGRGRRGGCASARRGVRVLRQRGIRVR